MSMAEINRESEPKFLVPETDPLPASKRMPDTDSLDEDEAERERKRQKQVVASDPVPEAPEGASDGDARHKDEKPAADPNGMAKGKGAPTAADKGKGIMVEDEEEENEEDDDDDDDDDSDDSTDVGSRDEIGGEGDDDSDFVDDPLAEVDLDNILPSRTRRREAPPPGAYFDPHQDEDDSDDSE